MKLYLFVFVLLIAVSACDTPKTPETTDPKAPETQTPKTSETATAFAKPEDALKAFVEGAKAKDEKAVKAALSKGTVEMLEAALKAIKKDDATIFDAEMFAEEIKMPETKDEKIEGDKATLMVKDKDDKDWDKMSFVKEDGSWKVDFASAFGEEKPEPKVETETPLSDDKTTTTEKDIKEASKPDSGKSFSDN